MAAIAAHDQKSPIGRSANRSVIAGPISNIPTTTPRSTLQAKRHAGVAPSPATGEGLSARPSITAIARREAANTAVLNPSPIGSSKARTTAAPRTRLVSSAARRGAASRAWITLAVG